MIRSEVKEIENWIREVRRDFHKHPEPRFKETRTAAKIAEHLHSIGLEVKAGVGGTGVVGLLRGVSHGKTFAIRADMDALPIEEETGATVEIEEKGSIGIVRIASSDADALAAALCHGHQHRIRTRLATREAAVLPR